MKFFFLLKFEIFYENYPPTRHMKNKRISFAPCNKSIMANKLVSASLQRFLRRIKSRLRFNSAKYFARLLSQIGQSGNL